MKNKFWISLLVVALFLSACGGKGSANQPALNGTHWVLEQINGSPVIENTLPSLSFQGDKEVGGNASCNRFNGSYEIKDGALTFSPLATTMMACPDPAGLMEQEAAYLKALEAAASYRVEDGKLLVSDASGKVVLVFAPQDMSLEGKIWNLNAFNDGTNLVSVLLDTAIHVEFKDGNVSGSSGCNTYSGAFQQDGQKLSFGTLASTLMACADEGVMKQETAYLNALAKVTHYSIEGNKLTLYDANNLIIAEFSK